MAIFVRQVVTTAGGPATSLTLTYGTVNPGNLLVIFIRYKTATITVGGGGNFYNLRNTLAENTGFTGVYDVLASNGGSIPITANFSTSQSVIEMSGYEIVDTLGGAWNFDTTVGGQATTGTALSAGPITNAKAYEILASYGNSSSSITAGTAGWTFNFTQNVNGIEYLVLSSVGANTATYTQTTTGAWGAIVGGWFPLPSGGAARPSTPWLEYIGVGRVI